MKIERMNRTLSKLLHVINRNLKSWEECLSFVEFVYNRVVLSTIEFFPFEIVYGFNSSTPIDLIHFPLDEMISVDRKKKRKK